MHWRDRLLLYRGGRRFEELSLCREYYKVPLAYVICEILETDDKEIKELERLVESIQALSKQYILGGSHLVLDESEEKRAERYVMLIKEATMQYFENCGASLFHKLLLLLPVLEAYIQSYDASERVLPSARYADEIRKKFFSKNIDSAELAAFGQAQQAAGKHAGEATAWASWSSLLLGEIDECMWMLLAQYLIDPENGYGKRLYLCVEEWKRLKQELDWIIVYGHREYSDKLRNLVIGPRKVSGDSFFSVPAENTTKYGDEYSITSLTELVLAEMDLLEKIDRSVRKCVLCERFFVPYQKEAEYCQRPNPDYNNKSCARVGSRLKFEKTHKQYDTPYGQIYRKNYKAYSKWLNENRKLLKQVIADLQGENETDKRSFLSEASNEMCDRMSKWDKNAKDALEKWFRGELSSEECEVAIQIPSIKERSALIWDLRRNYL